MSENVYTFVPAPAEYVLFTVADLTVESSHRIGSLLYKADGRTLGGKANKAVTSLADIFAALFAANPKVAMMAMATDVEVVASRAAMPERAVQVNVEAAQRAVKVAAAAMVRVPKNDTEALFAAEVNLAACQHVANVARINETKRSWAQGYYTKSTVFGA